MALMDKIKAKWRLLLDFSKYSFKKNIKDVTFYLVLFSFILNFLSWCLWRYSKKGPGLYGPAQRCLFVFTVPGHLIILGQFVILYLVDAKPSLNFQRICLSLAAILFGVTGVLAIINYFDHTHLGFIPLVIGICCVIVSNLLILDFIFNEHRASESKVKSDRSQR